MNIASLHKVLTFAVALFLATFRAHATDPPKTFNERIVAIESQHGGRLGVVALDTATHRLLAYRSTERFAMCSTFKLPLVAPGGGSQPI